MQHVVPPEYERDLMESSFALLGLAIALFASTNLDDILLLVGFFADPTFRDRDIVIGQYAGIAALFGVSSRVPACPGDPSR